MTITCSICEYFWVEQGSNCPRCWCLTEEQKNNPALKRIVSDPEITWDIDGTITTDISRLLRLLSNSAV